jgi:hypothetical protein
MLVAAGGDLGAEDPLDVERASLRGHTARPISGNYNDDDDEDRQKSMHLDLAPKR